MINLNGWDVASSIRIEHLSSELTKLIVGQRFDSVEDDCHISGQFAAWELSVPKRGGAVHLIVVLGEATFTMTGTPAQSCDGMRVGFDIDFVHMAATPADQRELMQLDFKSVGVGAGDSATFDVSWPGAGTGQPADSGSAIAMLQQMVGTLVINAILANPTLAATPIATLMQQGSIQASWYTPKHVDFAVSTLEDGKTYVSVLVSEQDPKPANLPSQPPAELHGGYVNMAFARGMFFAYVVSPSLRHRLGGATSMRVEAGSGTCTFSAAGDALATWTWPDFLAGLAVATVDPLILARIMLTLKQVSVAWVDANLESSISGECAPQVAGASLDSLVWYTFTGPATHAVVFDAAAQRLRVQRVMSRAATVTPKGLAAVSNFFAPSSTPAFQTGDLALNLCAVPEFPPVSQYSFIWVGVPQPQFKAANFDVDVVFHSAPDSAS